MLLRLVLVALLAASVSPVSSLEYKNNVMECMAKNIFYEAGNQSIKGKIAVAYVTYNRTLNDKFPDNVCSVVYQTGQFSWTKTKRRERIKNDWRWAESVYVANNFMLYPDPTKGSLFFHERSIRPKWGMKIIHTASIGNHMFYRFR